MVKIIYTCCILLYKLSSLALRIAGLTASGITHASDMAILNLYARVNHAICTVTKKITVLAKNNVQEPSKCCNCKSDHQADALSCPELAIRKEIREYAIYRNISLLNAKDIIRVNRFPFPYSFFFDEFSLLRSSPNHFENSRSSSSSTYRQRHRSYANAVWYLLTFSSKQSSASSAEREKRLFPTTRSRPFPD